MRHRAAALLVGCLAALELLSRPAGAGIRPVAARSPSIRSEAAARPAPAALLHLNLAKALRRALDNSPELAQQRSRVAQLSAHVNEVLAPERPQLALTPTATLLQPTLNVHFNGTTVPLQEPFNYNVGLAYSQIISTFGRLGRLGQAARLAVRQGEADYRAFANTLVQEVTAAYSSALLARRNVAIAEDQLKVAEQHLHDSEVLFKGGVVARFDVLSARTAASQAHQTLIAAVNASSSADSSLLSMLGEPTRRPLDLDPMPQVAPPPGHREAGLQQAYRRRPELGALGYAIGAAQETVRGIQAQLNPSLSLNSTYAVKNQVGFSASDNQWSTVVLFSVPILDGGLTRAQVKEAREAVVQLEASRESERRGIELEVQNAYLDMINTYDKIHVAREQVEEAREALRVAEVRYRNGVGTNTERLDATAALAQAEVSEAAATSQYEIAMSRWQRAIGTPPSVAVPAVAAPR